MNADWKNEQAILRDLAIVQGNVPVENVETVASNEKPPSIKIVEETEEQFLQQYVADVNTNDTLDLDLIQEMLKMVRDVRVTEIESPEVKDETEVASKKKSKSPQKCSKVEVEKKRNRNAAFESLLHLDQREGEQRENKTNSAIPFVVAPENMFKPKSSKSVDNTSCNNNAAVKLTKVNKPGVFVPSSNAQEYYEKVMEKKRQNELREENIWSRAERQMKEIEAKRKQTNIVK